MNKPASRTAKPLAEALRKTLKDAFAEKGFTSTEIVTRWQDIVGADIAAHSEPEKIQWPRQPEGDDRPSGTLVLRVEGPTAVEIQHLSRLILDRVNRYFGWQAVTDLRLRQAPLSRRERKAPPAPDRAAAERLAAELGQIDDENLRQALARLGAAVKQA